MDDLVKRLQDMAGDMKGTWDGELDSYADTAFDAADELEALRAELARLRALGDAQSALEDALRTAGPIHAGPVPGALGQKYPRARQCVVEFEDGSGAYDLQMVLATARATLAAWNAPTGEAP